MAYSPICRGILGGELRSAADLKEGDLRQSRYGRLEPGHLEANAALAARVARAAEARGLTAAQLSLAWVAARGEDVVPIPGTTTPAHLQSNADAMVSAAAAPLSTREQEELAALVPEDEVRGHRFAGDDPAKGTYKANM